MTNTSEHEEGAVEPSGELSRASQRSESGNKREVDITGGAAQVDSRDEPDCESKGRSASVPLNSLTPHYDAQYHQTYLRRLEEALKDSRNHNIALTGRYGAGKSSVLDKLEANHRKATQRLTISTLVPGEAGETTTNRIQKEIVKQLLYGASHKVGKNSRFSRIAVLTKRRALAQAIGIVSVVGGLLYLFGWLPDIRWTESGEDAWIRVTAWCGAVALAVAAVAMVRLATYGWFISDVSAGGATVTLKEAPSTFFDKYLDEIVHYFDRESKDIVIFEDLDRFEDRGIFEAVRELNILLNDTPHRRSRRRGNPLGRSVRWVLEMLPGDIPGWLIEKLSAKWSRRLLGFGVPLRFVYAVKDSMFEKLGADAKKLAAAGEAAAAETLRANRTKFFDIVIPIVPFISHRNARELLSDLLEESGITDIDRRLVGLVSQHTTDMRLLRNMCNEYLVFAERLLETNKTAPGLEPSKLFALVAYKNFHLEDFENISRRDSDLDRLYVFHQQLVRKSVAANEKRERDLSAGRDWIRTQEETAERVGQRLTRFAQAERRASVNSNWRYIELAVGSETFTLDEVNNYEFWAAVADAGTISIRLYSNAQRNQMTVLVTMDRADLEVMFPEGLDGNRWAELDEDVTRLELIRLAADVEALRRADFEDLAARPDYKLNVPDSGGAGDEVPGGGPAKAAYVDATFAQLVNTTMKSQLARDLVLCGYLDRNFSLYAAQFYGHFSGTDVANFMVHHVQTNTMNVDYNLKRTGAVANLLAEAEEAGEDFTNTVAAYNVDVVNYLLATDHSSAAEVVKRLVNEYDDDARTFLASYLTSGAQREALAARLAAQPWQPVFVHLVTNSDVPDDARTALVGAALAAANADAPYELPIAVGEFITANYTQMPAFTKPLSDGAVNAVVTMLARTSVRLPDLLDLDAGLCDLVVERDRYVLTGANLRTALGVDGEVPFDVVVADKTVYEYCLAYPGEYLAAVEQDSKTDHTVRTPDTLVKVLNDAAALWNEELLDEHLPALLGGAADSARIPRLRLVPTSSWVELAGSELFDATLANVARYSYEIGAIDAGLAGLLEAAGSIAAVDDGGDEEFDPDAVAVAVLNASTFSSTKARVDLASSLNADFPLQVTEIVATTDDLFARMLTGSLVADDSASFEHFHAAGWEAIGPAIRASSGIATFLTPDLVFGMVDNVLNDPVGREKLGGQIVSDVEAFVPEFDAPTLQSVAQYADQQGIGLRPESVARIAAAQPIQGELVLRLLAGAAPAATAPQIVEVFNALGGEYAKVSRSGAKFQVIKNPLHMGLLTTLRQGGIITFRKKTGRDIYDVKVT